jgi:hypothetical protein
MPTQVNIRGCEVADPQANLEAGSRDNGYSKSRNGFRMKHSSILTAQAKELL